MKNYQYSNRGKGFTLIEVLLAIGISALVLACAYSAFRLGWLSYSRLNNQLQVYHNLRNGLYALGKDVRNVFLLKLADNKTVTLSGSQKEIFFVTLIKARDKEGVGYTDTAKAFYKFEGKNLLRAYLKNTEMLKLDAEPAYGVFLADISDGEFLYAVEEPVGSGQLVWKNNFEQKDAFPKAVRVKLTQTIPNQQPITLTKSIPLAYETAQTP